MLPPSPKHRILEQTSGRLGLVVSLAAHLLLGLFAAGSMRPAVPVTPPPATQVVMRLQAPVPAPVPAQPAPVPAPPAPVPPQPRPPEPRPVKPEPPPKPRPRKPEVRKETIPDPVAEPEPVEEVEPRETFESPAPTQDAPPALAGLRPGVPDAPAGPPAAFMDSAMLRQEEKDRLLSELLALIEREKFYPFAARRRGIKGQVELVIEVDAFGRIRDYRVASASHGVFANAATTIMARVQSAASRRALSNAREFSLSVGLTFELKE